MSCDAVSSDDIRARLAKAQAILLDLDGTLIETDNRWAEMMAGRLAWLERLFPRLDTERLARAIVMRSEIPVNYLMMLMEHLGLDTNFFGIADRVRRSKGLATNQGVLAVNGTPALLEQLGEDYALAIVTTRGGKETRTFLDALDLLHFFSVIVTRQQVLRMKPHPEPILVAAQGLGKTPQRCVMVGDTVMDMRAAQRAGSIAVGVLSGFGHRQELERAGADLILDRAEQILSFLPQREAIQ